MFLCCVHLLFAISATLSKRRKPSNLVGNIQDASQDQKSVGARKLWLIYVDFGKTDTVVFSSG